MISLQIVIIIIVRIFLIIKVILLIIRIKVIIFLIMIKCSWNLMTIIFFGMIIIISDKIDKFLKCFIKKIIFILSYDIKNIIKKKYTFFI